MSRPLSQTHRVTLALAAVVGLAQGCGPGFEPGQEDEVDPSLGVVSFALSSIDCAESTNTGYDNGKAFAITVVHVDGEPVEVATANAYYVMAQAAEAAGVHIKIVSGFRTYAEQQYLYNCYVNCNCNSCNLAAKPGYSNHQSGHALDLNTSTASVLNWLNAHGGAYGFKRTVPSEAWHWEWWGGGPGGGPCGNRPPTGWLDAATCEAASGWAQDPNDPGRAIDVHVYYGGPAGSGSPGIPTNAGIARSDLCSAIGSCNHGFSLLSPLSLFDGAAHPVHAYGIDSKGGANPQLQGSPRSMQCKPTPPAGAKRHVTNPTVFAAWQFNAFRDQMKVSDALLAAMPTEKDISPAPVMIRADGAPEVYLVDQGYRRHVPNPTVAANWRLDLGKVQVKKPTEVSPIPVAAPLRTRPVLVMGSGSAVWLVDDALPVPAGPDAGRPGPDASAPHAGPDARAAAPDAGTTDPDPSDTGTTPQPGTDASGSPALAVDASTPDLDQAVEGGCGCGPGGGASGGLTALALCAVAALRTRRRH